MDPEKQAFALPVIREVLPAAEETASYPVFPFVMVRSPRLATAPASNRDVAYQRNSSLANELSKVRSEQADDALAQRQEMQALATNAVAEQAEQRTELLPRALALAQLGRWLREGQEGLSEEALEARPKAEVLNDQQVQLVWDVLFQQALLGAQAVNFPEPVAVLKAQQFLQVAKEEGLTPEVAQRQASAELFLPPAIFPLSPLPAPEPPVAEPVPSLTPKYERLAALQTTAQELRYQQDLQAEIARTTPAPPRLTFAGDGPSDGDTAQASKPSPEQLADLAQAQSDWNVWKAGQEKASYVVLRSLSKTAVAVLKSLRLPKQIRFDFALDVLNRQAAALTTELSQQVPEPASLFRAGGALWAREASGSATNNLTSGSGSGPVSITSTPVDPYDAFYDIANNPGAVNRIRPIGIADLNVVEQTLCCYKAGEVAHLENVMQGEYKERSTRRLSRSEVTLSVETMREAVQERDTTTTDRYELQKETSRVLQEDQSFSLGVTATASWGPVSIGATANYATATASQTSDRQTATYAKNIVDRSVQRVTERVQERRTSTQINEFEENSKHGLDNRNGSKHVVGLYRWIDKVYRMQVVNYGRRLMFEFAVPEPGFIHLWAMAKASATNGTSLTPPRGTPRTTPLLSGGQALDDFSKLNETNYAAWAAAYGAAVEPAPAEHKNVNTTVDASRQNPNYYTTWSITTGRPSTSLEVPAGYETESVTVLAEFRGSNVTRGDSPTLEVIVGGQLIWVNSDIKYNPWREEGGRAKPLTAMTTIPLTGVVPLAFQALGTEVILFSVTLKCRRTTATYQAWQIRTFSAIMAAYQAKQDAYDQALAEAKAGMGSDGIRGTNPARNRQIERTELKRGCINWLFNGTNYGVYGTYPLGPDDPNPPVQQVGAGLLAQADRAKFIEQCFEWDLLTYTLYPYYWLPKEKWRAHYQLDDTDPLFLSFLQAGLARVVVSVRPGFEKAALHFLRTGQLWNGGDTPGANSPLYLSVMAELLPPARTRVGQPWEVRVPTELTVLQAESGAIPGKGLPCDCTPSLALGTVSSPMGK